MADLLRIPGQLTFSGAGSCSCNFEAISQNPIPSHLGGAGYQLSLMIVECFMGLSLKSN